MTKSHSSDLDDAPPDWQTIELPESQVLRRRKPWHIRLNSMGIQNLMLALKANPDAVIFFLCISVHTGSHNDHAESRRLRRHSHTTGIRNGPRDPAYDDLVTDAHCHPTDLPFSEQTVRDVGLGGLSSMATRTTDQELVSKFSEDHGRRDEDEYGKERESKRRRRAGPEVIACFGEHCRAVHSQRSI